MVETFSEMFAGETTLLYQGRRLQSLAEVLPPTVEKKAGDYVNEPEKEENTEPIIFNRNPPKLKGSLLNFDPGRIQIHRPPLDENTNPFSRCSTRPSVETGKKMQNIVNDKVYTVGRHSGVPAVRSNRYRPRKDKKEGELHIL